jgi:DnaJ-class molecular chaperone
MSYYESLGVDKTASKDEIKKAYKKLAMKSHPDKGGDTEVFKKISEAYEILSDEDKRNEYDNPRQQFNPFDVFGQMFGRQVRRLQDHRHVIKISLLDAYKGRGINLNVKMDKKCLCVKTCEVCKGSGNIGIQHPMMMGMIIQQPCGKCSASGVFSVGCLKCAGKGVLQETNRVSINIPAGVENGHQEILEGLGEQSINSNDIAGNLTIIIQVEEHSIFKRSGDDLIFTKKISLGESIVGLYVGIPHFDGDIIHDTRQYGIINPSKLYIVPGKGMTSRGSLQIKFDIQYPNVPITDDMRDEIKELKFLFVD